MEWPSECIGIAILLILFSIIVAGVEVLQRVKNLHAESARKSIHVLGGLGCILFPTLLDSWVSVLIVASFFAIFFFFGEKYKLLKSLSGVTRKSYGSVLFPISILLLFIISGGEIWIYCSSLLVLVLSDSAAAITGVKYGMAKFMVTDKQKKSLEGSLAFFVISLIVITLSIFLLSDFTFLPSLLTAVLMSLLLTGVEAISVHGSDNILLPLVSVFILKRVPESPIEQILFKCCCVAISLSLLFYINKKFKHLEMRNLIIYCLIGYSSWALGSFEYGLPYLTSFIVYHLFCRSSEKIDHTHVRVGAFIPLSIALIILFLANLTNNFSFYFAPYLFSMSCMTSLFIIFRYKLESRSFHPIRLVLIAFVPLIANLAIPFTRFGAPIVYLAIASIDLTLFICYSYYQLMTIDSSLIIERIKCSVILFIDATMIAILQLISVLEQIKIRAWSEVFK